MYRSAEQAQINAINQPMTVQPNSRLTMKIPIASALCRPMSVGKKYNRMEKNRKNILAPPQPQFGLRQAH
jgi:hypothetical protein